MTPPISAKAMWNAGVYLARSDFALPTGGGKLQQLSREQLRDAFERLQALQHEDRGWVIQRADLAHAPAAKVPGYELGELFNAFVALDHTLTRHANPTAVSAEALSELRAGTLTPAKAQRLHRNALTDAYRLANPYQERAFQDAARAELAAAHGQGSAAVTFRSVKPSLELAEEHARRTAALESIVRLHLTGLAPASRDLLFQTVEQLGRYARVEDLPVLEALTAHARAAGDDALAAASMAAEANVRGLEKLNVAMIQLEGGLVPGAGVRAYVNPLAHQLAENGHAVDVYLPLVGDIDLAQHGLKAVPGSEGSVVDPAGRTVGFQLYERKVPTAGGGEHNEYYFADDHYFTPRKGVYEDTSGELAAPFEDKDHRLAAGAMLANAAMSKVAALRKLGGGEPTAEQVARAEDALARQDVPHVIQWNDSHLGIGAAYLQFNDAFKHAAPLGIVHNADDAYMTWLDSAIANPALGALGGRYAAAIPDGEYPNLLEVMAGTMRMSGVSRGFWERLLNESSRQPRLQAALQEAEAEGRFGWVRNGIDIAKQDASRIENTTQAAAFSPADLSGKLACKRALQADFGLPVDEGAPVLAFGHRMVGQKGLNELLAVLRTGPDGKPVTLLDQVLLEHPRTQLIIGGPDVEASLKPQLEALAARWPDNVRVEFGRVDNRRLMSGADVFLMPSVHEPCGIAQMEAQSMGAAVLATDVDGLKDTVIPWDALTGSGTGFISRQGDPASLLQSFRDAISWASRSPREKGQLQRNALELAQTFDVQPWARNHEALLRESVQLARSSV